MRLVSWNCRLNSRDKREKLIEILPDIAVIQESPHPDNLGKDLLYENALWVGKEMKSGLGVSVLSFSQDYQLILLVDEVKYEWIVPIRVTGKENFTLIAVWAKRMPGSSYGKVLYSALHEYERIIQNGPVIIMGDFNLDKKVPSSYSGIGYEKIMDKLESYGLVSCYHSITMEEFSKESIATYYHYGKLDKPFHVDYCFGSKDVLQGIQSFYTGTPEDYLSLSHHVPLVLEFALGLTNKSTADESIQNNEKTILTPEILKEDYLLQIDRVFASSEELEEAIKYIRALRIMKDLK